MSRVASSASAPVRKKRTPISSRNVLTVTGKDPDYEYRIVNDVGDRIAQFEDAGYELVGAKDVRVGDRSVNKASPEGSKAQVSVSKTGEKAFVMRIRKEDYAEDQKLKHEQVQELERTIKQTASEVADYGKLSISTGSA